MLLRSLNNYYFKNFENLNIFLLEKNQQNKMKKKI